MERCYTIMERSRRKVDNGEMAGRGREMSFEKVSSQIYLFFLLRILAII